MRSSASVIVVVESVSDAPVVPAWVASVLDVADAEVGVELVQVLVVPRPASRRVAERIYVAIDRRRHASGTDAVLGDRDLRRSFATRLAAGREHLQIDGVAIVVDLRVHPSAAVAGDPIETWSLELRRPSGELIDGELVDAFAARDAVCEVTLVRRRGSQIVRDSSVVALARASLSVSQARVFDRGGALVERALRARSGDAPPPAGGAAGDPRSPDDGVGVRLAPHRGSAAHGSWWAARAAGERLVAAARGAIGARSGRREQWVLGVRNRGVGRAYADPTGYTPLLPPEDRMYADPFVVEADDRAYVFLEEMRFANPRGVLSVAELDAEGRLRDLRVVLDRPYHLSFPNVFRHDGTWLMLPETSENGTVELYRADRFPDQWRLERVLLSDVRARDTVVHRSADRWWMFTTMETRFSRHDELHLFSSDDLLGPWVPHPRNPVVSDVRGARGAGAIFEDAGELIRPAQDCSELYGGALVFHRVTELDPQRYAEETVAYVAPTWTKGLHGVHTYNRSASFEVVDGARRLP